ncbi:MAG: STAS domain-containing protein [Actinomycetota bacterium]|nr:STAS domain-containing protein [Actinomycetota bacterium]
MTPSAADGPRKSGRPGSGDAAVFFDEAVTLIMLSGEVDLALGEDLEYAGRDAIDRGTPVLVDVSKVTFIDSVGLGFLARMASAERDKGRRLPLAGAARTVQEAIRLVGLTELVEFVDAARSAAADAASADAQNGTTSAEG